MIQSDVRPAGRSRRGFILTASGAVAAAALPASTRARLALFRGFANGTSPSVGLEDSISRQMTASYFAANGTLYYVGINANNIDSNVFQSKDNGKTFTAVATFAGQQFESYCFTANAQGYLFLSPWGPAVSSALRGLLMSKDNGRTWTRVIDFSPFANQIGIWGITSLPDGSMYAGVYSDGLSHYCGIFRSLNGGLTWSPCYYDPAARHVHNVNADPKTGYVYASTGDNFAPWNTNYVIRSTNRGQTWTKILNTLPQIVPIGITPTGRLFGSDDPNYRAIYRSTDDKTYQQVLAVQDMFTYWIRRDDVTGWVYAGFVTDPPDTTPTLAEIHVSKNDGQNWTLHSQWSSVQPFDGVPFASNISSGKMAVCVIASGQEQNATLIHTQSSVSYLTRQITASHIGNDGTITYVGINNSDSCVFQSKDSGVTWSTAATFPGQQFESRCVGTNPLGDLFISPWGGAVNNATRGLWASRNNGQSWSRVIDLSKYNGPVGFWGIASYGDGSMYAGVYSETSPDKVCDIYRSTNYGASWSLAYHDPLARHIHDVQVDPVSGTVYATYGDSFAPWNVKGILKSTDRGNTWTKILLGLPQMVPICVTPTARLFGTDDANQTGIYRTTDDKTATLVLAEANAFSFWMRRDPVTGWIYIGFINNPEISGPIPATGKIYVSKDDGQSWGLHSVWPAVQAYDGPNFASNISNGKMAINVQYLGNELNGALIQTS